MAFDIQSLQAGVSAANGAIALIKSIVGMLPKADKPAVEEKIREAEQALALANAQLAQGLNYPLCRCTFPPKIMLWREDERAWVGECGHRSDVGSENLDWESGVP